MISPFDTDERPTPMNDTVDPQCDAQTDECLLARYQRDHDDLAFQTLYDRRSPELRIFLEHRKKIALAFFIDMDDILEDTFSKLAEYRNPTNESGNNVRALLYRIATDLCVDRLRAIDAQKRGYRVTHQLNPDTEDKKTAKSICTSKTRVADLMECLSAVEAEVVQLVCLEEHTVRSAADILGLPVTTVENRLRASKKRMAELGRI